MTTTATTPRLLGANIKIEPSGSLVIDGLQFDQLPPAAWVGAKAAGRLFRVTLHRIYDETVFLALPAIVDAVATAVRAACRTSNDLERIVIHGRGAMSAEEHHKDDISWSLQLASIDAPLRIEHGSDPFAPLVVDLIFDTPIADDIAQRGRVWDE